MNGDDCPAAARGQLADHACNVPLRKIVTGELSEGNPLPWKRPAPK